MDLEFCVQCVLVSTGKIFGVAEDVSDMDVTNMMRTSFPEGGRITINQILRYVSTLLIYIIGGPLTARR